MGWVSPRFQGSDVDADGLDGRDRFRVGPEPGLSLAVCERRLDYSPKFDVPLIPGNDDDFSDPVAERQEKARLGSVAGASPRRRERS